MEHGTLDGYKNHKCRCVPCRKAAREDEDDRRTRQRAEGMPADLKHGTRLAYGTYLCKCPECRQWKVVDGKVRQDLARAHVNAIKNNPCLDCGHTFPTVCMQFDHTSDDKTNNVSTMVMLGYSIARIDIEIAKCELVCANCHAIRTDRRRREENQVMALANAGTE